MKYIASNKRNRFNVKIVLYSIIVLQISFS